MPDSEKRFTPEVHDGVVYAKDEKDKAVSSPSNASDDCQDAQYGINERALLRKLDFNLLPALTLLYLLSFLDRSNGKLLKPDNLGIACSYHSSRQRACRGFGGGFAYE